MKKKLVATLMAAALVLTACSSGNTQTSAPAAASSATEAASAEANAPEQADGEAKIAVVTDVGQLMDKGFNQGTYEGAQAYA